MRTFIAIGIPKNIKDKIGVYEEPLRKERAKISWIKPENIHITLKFLGEVEENKIQEIYEALKKCVSNQKPFDIEVIGTGGFPNLNRPRIIWVGLKKGSEELKTLAKSIDNELEKLGFRKEKRGFSPHLTVGRVKNIYNIHEFVEKMNSVEFKGDTFTADEILIMKSDLKPTGAVYTKLHTIKL